ncbi:hypothetical protein DU316_17645 [Escherichia coli]|nr:hypothetical protein DU316_17645 [Escherichia coli]
MVILVGLAIDQIAQSGLSSLSVIYYSAQLFRKASRSLRDCISSVTVEGPDSNSSRRLSTSATLPLTCETSDDLTQQ